LPQRRHAPPDIGGGSRTVLTRQRIASRAEKDERARRRRRQGLGYRFAADVVVHGDVLGHGEGTSKKAAERAAAAVACEAIVERFATEN
jgi:dsRNA-specific ribonuclease